MPISFQQPSPLAPGFTAGAGAAQQYSRDLPTLASMYERLFGPRGGGGGGHHPGPATFQQNFSQRGPAAQGIGGGGQQQQAQPLNAAERIHMARLQAGLAAVDRAMFDGSITPQEGQQYKLQIQTGLNPLMQKQQAATAQMKQEQAKMVHEQAAQLEGIRQGNAEARAKGLPFAMSEINVGGRKHTVFSDDQGKFHDLSQAQADSDVARAKAIAQQELAERKHRQTAWHQAGQAALATLSKVKKHDEQGNELPVDENELRELTKRNYANSPQGQKDEADFWATQGPGAVPGSAPQTPPPAAPVAAPPGRAPISEDSRKAIHEAMKKHMPEMVGDQLLQPLPSSPEGQQGEQAPQGQEGEE